MKFPKMFDKNYTNVWADSEYIKATGQNLKLVLLSMRGELLGDPYFGLLLKQYLFSQNDYILRDMLIDMIYTQVAIFIPQFHVARKDITILPSKKRGQLICQIYGTNQVDFTPNTFELLLLDNETSA
jgi:hypothetical protein